MIGKGATDSGVFAVGHTGVIGCAEITSAVVVRVSTVLSADGHDAPSAAGAIGAFVARVPIGKQVGVGLAVPTSRCVVAAL